MGTTRLRGGVKRLGGCAGCWSIQRQKDSPVFPVFLPICRWGLCCGARRVALVALVRRWGGLLYSGGAPEGAQLPWDAGAEAKPTRLPRSSCCTPRSRSFGFDTLLPRALWARGGVEGAGGGAVTPPPTRAPGGAQGTLAAPAFPVPLCHLCQGR